MTVRGEPYVAHTDLVRRKVLFEIATQKKSIAIIAELNGVPASTVCTWVKLAGLDRGRPAYKARQPNRKNNPKLPTPSEVAVVNSLLNTWRLK